MIRPLATFLRALDAARTAGTLARTVRVLARQLDNAHLLAASEEARADRAELRVAELERALQDWREASGELAREQPADDALPSVLDAGEAPIPLVLTDSAREADIQRDRADALQRALQACEVELVDTRAELANERRREEAQHARASAAERERDAAARAAGAHIATIEALREQIAAAHRAAHAIAPADPPCQCGHPASVHGREGCGAPGEDTHACPCERFQVYGHHPRPAEQIPGVAAADDIPDGYWAARAERRERATIEAARATAGTDDPPPTRPSERTATRTT